VVSKLNSTYNTTALDFELRTAHKILQGGTIEITLPRELKLTENTVCLNNLTCVLLPKENKFQVMDMFSKAPQTDTKVPIVFTVGGIFTYRAVKPTGNFNFQTLDKDGYSIDNYRMFFLPAFTSTARIEYAKASADNTEVGGLATYSF
jgi:hypothetical protein